MYARSYNDEEKQSFSRGEYNIPANYHGNAFTADEPPNVDEPSLVETKTAEYFDIDEEIHIPPPSDKLEKSECCCEQPLKEDRSYSEPRERKGILGGILSKFDKGFKLDDLLIIGLILLLLNGEKSECTENRDEIVILLALLLLGG